MKGPTLTAVSLTLLLTACPVFRCGDRTDGALVTLHFDDAKVTLWMTNDAFIDTALDLEATGEVMVPVFDQVIAGSDCDGRWSWHVDPEDAEWADFAIEICDANPHFIEANRDAWIENPGGWCPFGVERVGVRDLRR